MAKFRVKSVVDAVQLRWDTWNEVCDLVGEFPPTTRGVWVDAFGNVSDGYPGGAAALGLQYRDSKDYERVAVEGDWIIKGVTGLIFHCPADEFAGKYEAVKGPYYTMGSDANGLSWHLDHTHVHYNEHPPLS